ncbi:hypothetical protein HYH02_003053 [Chlamydomonas schloesseri]|uniref:Uncharacterized protein n=1 Tax=Chlamydomonas schloesseri TaxID=2026947 RepID=A0A835WSG5_9CHLO|nr:hypothetical protein HYH02_003053 [Chlamydomonas schloesseri]|eukprot:KAG2452011.1 hypothetical protein HYH02_003053 [Chlamydomonas schloesseri]
MFRGPGAVRTRTISADVDCLFTRPDPDDSSKPQTLVACDGLLCPLKGAAALASGAGSFALEEPLALYLDKSSPWASLEVGGLSECVYDSWSASSYFKLGRAVVRLLGDGMSPVAGHPNEAGHADGPGPIARFSNTYVGQMASDGAGNLFLADGPHVRRIQLPAAWRAAPAPATPATAPAPAKRGEAGHSGSDGDSARGGGSRIEAAAAALAGCRIAGDVEAPDAEGQEGGSWGGEVAQVSTLPPCLPGEDTAVHSVAFVPAAANARGGAGGGPAAGDTAGASAAAGTGWLVLGTQTALYRLRLPLPLALEPPAAPSPGGSSATAPSAAPPSLPSPPPSLPRPQLFAGREGQRAIRDGARPQARFWNVLGMTVDAAGRLYLMDRPNRGGGCLRCVSPPDDSSSSSSNSGGGVVATLLTCLPLYGSLPAILPGGWLAVCDGVERQLVLLDLGLQPPPLTST